MRRRTFLKGAGALSVLLAGGAGWRAHDQGVLRVGGGAAYEPWDAVPADEHEDALALVRAGILGANPHNTQPWRFAVTPSRIELYGDTTRHLGTFDPYLREMHLGLGCALENIVRAARVHGYKAQLTLSRGSLDALRPDAGASLAAGVDLISVEPRDDILYTAIPRRHTHRGEYERERQLPAELLQTMLGMADGSADMRMVLFSAAGDRQKFGELVIGATEAIVADASMVSDSERWFRHSWRDVQERRDGVTLDAAGLSPLMAAVAKMLPRPSPEDNHRYWLDATRETHVATRRCSVSSRCATSTMSVRRCAQGASGRRCTCGPRMRALQCSRSISR